MSRDSVAAPASPADVAASSIFVASASAIAPVMASMFSRVFSCSEVTLLQPFLSLNSHSSSTGFTMVLQLSPMAKLQLVMMFPWWMVISSVFTWGNHFDISIGWCGAAAVMFHWGSTWPDLLISLSLALCAAISPGLEPPFFSTINLTSDSFSAWIPSAAPDEGKVNL